jgi:hypothetical protein
VAVVVVAVEVVGVIVVVVTIIITTTTITVNKGAGNGLNVGECIPDRGCPREFRSYKTNRNKTGNERINVTLRCLRATTVAVEKQLILHILSVCAILQSGVERYSDKVCIPLHTRHPVKQMHVMLPHYHITTSEDSNFN